MSKLIPAAFVVGLIVIALVAPAFFSPAILPTQKTNADTRNPLVIEPLATFSFPFPTRTPTPTPTPIPTPTPVPTPKPILQTPTLEVSCKATAATADGYQVEIYGKLLQNDSRAFADAPIVASYSATGGALWEDVNLVRTASDGSFVAIWTPNAAGSYLVRVLFEETSVANGVNKTVNVALASDQQNLFTINSNSDIAEPTFDATTRTLTFNASGEAGTTGYLNIFVPKSVASTLSNLKIYLDDNPVAFNSETQADSWLLTFTYTHSQHTITIVLPEQSTLLPNGSDSDWMFYAVLIVIVLVVVASVFGLVKRRRRLQRYAKYIADAKKTSTPLP